MKKKEKVISSEYIQETVAKYFSIDKKELAGEKQAYYILKMPGEVKVMVPISTAEQHGIRNVIDKNEAERVINVLEQDETEMEKNWNKRYRDNMDKMKN